MQFKLAYLAPPLSDSLFPLTYSASRVLSPLKHYFDEERCFPCVKHFKARVVRAIKASLWAHDYHSLRSLSSAS